MRREEGNGDGEREVEEDGAKTRCSRARAVEEKKEKREKKVKVSKNVNKQHKKLTKLELVESMLVVMKRCSRSDAKGLMRGRDERG